MDIRHQIFMRILLKIVLKREGFGILMVDGGAAEVALVGARFIGEHNMLRPDQISGIKAEERHNR